jgi:hypothetical protein
MNPLRCESLALVTVKFTVLWDVTPCSLEFTDVSDNSEDGGSRFVRNVGRPHYTVSHLTRKSYKQKNTLGIRQ